MDGKSALLYHIRDFPLFDKEIIEAGTTYVADDNYFEALPNLTFVLKIKTRKRTHFENEVG